MSIQRTKSKRPENDNTVDKVQMKKKSRKTVVTTDEQKNEKTAAGKPRIHVKSSKHEIKKTSTVEKIADKKIKKTPSKTEKTEGKHTKPVNKRERRELKLKSKKYPEVVKKILSLWEVLRREDTEKDKRFDIVGQMLDETKDSIVDMCLAHDTARIMECAIQHGTEAQRWKFFTQVRKELILLTKSRYGKFVVLKLIKYGDQEHRLEMFKLFRGHVSRLVNNKIAIEVVDTLYNEHANASQRGELMQELYGNVHALRLAENQVHTLSDALALNPDKRAVILSNVAGLVTNLTIKGLTKYCIVQHLLLEYLQAMPLNGEQTKASSTKAAEPMDVDEDKSAEVVTSRGNVHSILEAMLEGHLVPMLHTRDGVRAALRLLWAASPRIRKQLVRGLKAGVTSIGQNEHGHLFLIGLLDFVDDIVLLEKVVIKEILEDLTVFCVHPEARKVLLYALSPRDTRHLSPQLQASLVHPGDANPFTKKPLGIRAMELRSPKLRLLPKLLHLVKDKLTEVFTGDSSAMGQCAIQDRGRLVLLSEILVRSAPYHLQFDNVMASYTRTDKFAPATESADALLSSTTCQVDPSEMEELQKLRQQVMENVIRLLLAPEFVPHGPVAKPPGGRKSLSRDEQRIRRHKHAVNLVERIVGAAGKQTVKPFTSGDAGEAAEEEVEEDEEMKNEADEALSDPPANVLTTIPFIERPEGQMSIRRLLQDGKDHEDSCSNKEMRKYVKSSALH